MRNIWKKCVVASLVLSSLLVGCSAKKSEDQLAAIKEKGKLVVGTEGTYSPNSYHDGSGNLVGFDVDVARAIGKHLGVEVEFYEAKWDSLFAAMDSGRVDTVINEVEYNEDRAKKYDFSDPYCYIHGALLVPEGSDITSFDQVSGKKCAQNATSSWGKMAESLGAELVPVDSMSQTIDLLTSGRADATLNAETAFSDYLRNHPDQSVKIAALTDTTSSSLVPVKKGQEELVKAINEALQEMKDSGELAEISNQYFGMDVSKE